MKLATVITEDGREQAAVVTDRGAVPIRRWNEAAGTAWSTDLFALLANGELDALREWLRSGGGAEMAEKLEPLPPERTVYGPLYRRPRKIWGIGANYWAKAADMAVTPPEGEPICFLKPDTALIGPGDAILLPAESEQVTAEAEIGIIIGKTCKHVSVEEALGAVAGFTTTLDMTAQDIHARNPRFLGRSKCFDTFFSFGPHLVTPDECPAPEEWTVETVLNGSVVHRSAVAHMIYPIPYIVSYFSGMMTLLPGDVIMTGTPGSVPIKPQDTAECRIAGFSPLRNPVRAEEPSPERSPVWHRN